MIAGQIKRLTRACENPFRAQRIDRLPYLPIGVGLEDLWSKLEAMRYRATIIGPEGSGKTTLLAAVNAYLKWRDLATKTILLNEDNPLARDRRKRLFSELGDGRVLLLDGADHLDRLTWWRLKRKIFRQGAGLIVTSHKVALLPVLVECSTSTGLLEKLVRELLPANRSINSIQLVEIYNECKGDIRNCLRKLYDLWDEKAIITSTE